MKKTIAVLIVLAAVISAVSCAAPEEYPELMYEEPQETLDFQGEEFVVIGGYYPESGASYIGDICLQRWADVAKKYNVTLVRNNMHYGFTGIVLEKKLAGVKYSDLSWARIDDLVPLYRNNLLFQLNGTSHLDVTDEACGFPSVLEPVRFDGENYYAVQSNYWPNLSQSVIGDCIVNYRQIRINTQPDPYELLENGKWTWENFEAIARACRNETEGIYGVTTEHDEMINSAIFSNNQDLLVKNESTGLYEFGFTSYKALEAAEWVKSLVDAKLVYHWTSGQAGSNGQVIFTEDKSVFYVGNGYYGISEAGIPLEEGYGFLPMAFGPSNPDQIWNTKFDAREEYYTVIDSNDVDIDKSLLFLSALIEKIPDCPSWQEYYRSYVFFDDRSADCYIRMVEISRMSGQELIGGVQLDAFNAIMGGSASPKEKLDTLQRLGQNAVDKNLNEIK